MCSKILIYDEISTNRATIKAMLETEYMQAESYADISDFQQTISQFSPDIILIAENIGWERIGKITKHIKNTPRLMFTPLILLSETNEINIKKLVDHHIDDIQTYTKLSAQLIARLRYYIPQRTAMLSLFEQTYKQETFNFCDGIASLPFIEEKPITIADINNSIPEGFAAISPVNTKILKEHSKVKEDIVLLGISSEQRRKVAELRQNSDTHNPYIICITNSPENASILLDIGADNIIEANSLTDRITLRMASILYYYQHKNNLKRILKQRLQEARIDAVTGLYNRYHASELLNMIFNQSKTEAIQLSIITFDIDHFKSVNDTYGHPAGDYVLQKISQIIKAHLRNGEFIARMGGDEFLIILPNINLQRAYNIAQRLRNHVNDATFILNNKKIKTTISLGIAHSHISNSTSKALLKQADCALYIAKAKGRNCVAGKDILDQPHLIAS